MPLVLEEDIRLANGFDPASAATLYWKDVPVLVKQHDREDQTDQLTFRILSGVTRQNHSFRVSKAAQFGHVQTADIRREPHKLLHIVISGIAHPHFQRG
jgi:hypothetical protein